MTENNAPIILEVAAAIGAHLEMSELLAALNEKLKPIICFDAIGIGVLEDEVLRIYFIHLESTRHVERKSLLSLMGCVAGLPWEDDSEGRGNKKSLGWKVVKSRPICS